MFWQEKGSSGGRKGTRQSCFPVQLQDCAPRSAPVGWVNVDATCGIAVGVSLHGLNIASNARVTSVKFFLFVLLG